MTETPEYVVNYTGSRNCRYCDETAAFDVAGFLSCGDLVHLGRASDEWVEAKRSKLEEAGQPSRPLISQSTLDEIDRVGREWPDGIHTCAELQRLEPGRRPCTCGRCPSPDSLEARAARLLAQFRNRRAWLSISGEEQVWLGEVSDLLSRIAGES